MTLRDQELRSLAEKATPGEWKHVKRGAFDDVESSDGQVASVELDDDATYIAAASPQTILSLLDRLEAVEGERDTLREVLSELVADAEKAVNPRSRLLNYDRALEALTASPFVNQSTQGERG